jgi:SAM-dependent methyltransferase
MRARVGNTHARVGERRHRLRLVAAALHDIAGAPAGSTGSSQNGAAHSHDNRNYKGYEIIPLDRGFRAVRIPSTSDPGVLSSADSLSACSEEGLKRIIDARTAEMVEDYRGYLIYRYEYKFFALPKQVTVFSPEEIVKCAQKQGAAGHSRPEIRRAIDSLLIGPGARETLILETLPRPEMASLLAKYEGNQITLLSGTTKAPPSITYPTIKWVGAHENGRACFGRTTIAPALLARLQKQRFGRVIVPCGNPETWGGAGAEDLASAISENLEIVLPDGSRRQYQGENAHRIVYNKAYLSSMFQVVPGVAGRAVLDVGCSDGLVCDLLARLGARTVVGLDVMNTVGCAFPDPVIEYHSMDGAHMAFPDGTFDLCLSIATMEHVPDPFAVMMEMRRVLAVGGYGYVQAGPLYHSPFGHHMFAYFPDYPWIHLRLPIEKIIKLTVTRGIDQSIAYDLATKPEDYIRSMLNPDHINGLFLKDYRLDEFMAQNDIEVLKFNVSHEGKDLLTAEIMKEIPAIDPEQLTEHGFEIAFRKIR